MDDFEFTVSEDLCKVDCHHNNKSPYIMIHCNLSNKAFHDFVKSLKNRDRVRPIPLFIVRRCYYELSR